LFTGVLTDATGKYDFLDLANGDYKVDFNQVKTSTQYFTIKGNSADLTKNSTVEYLGVNSGTVISINPTTATSKTVNAGVLDYTPSSQLNVSLNKTGTTLTITTAGSNPTEQLVATILPTFFDAIKHPTNAITRTTNSTNVVTTTSDGLLEGKAHGTGIITVTIRDVYGNTAQT
jgi:hypothetical protein